MLERSIVLKNESGLHARPAGIFAKAAAGYQSNVQIRFDGKQVNAKSVMSVMSLGLDKGAEITLVVDGSDEEVAIQSLVDLVENQLMKA